MHKFIHFIYTSNCPNFKFSHQCSYKYQIQVPLE